MDSERTGRRAKDGPDGCWHRALEFVAAIILSFLDFLERSATAIDKKIYGIKRSRRKKAVAIIALGATALPLFIWLAMLDGDAHDARIAHTGPTVEARMVGEDPYDCLALIELGGTEYEAVTSCGPSSFAPGATVWVAEDPAEAGRYMLVVPGEEWWVPDAVDRLIGIGVSVVIGLLLWAAGYAGLLRADAPSNRKPANPRNLSDGAPGRARSDPDTSMLSDAEAGWEGFKASVGNRLERFGESDIRLRGSLMSMIIIVVLAVAGNMSLGIGRELQSDKALIASQPVIEVVLLDFGYKDTNAMVRHDSARKELAYPLAADEGTDLGDRIRVVVDPSDADRLIPVSVARGNGIMLWFELHGPIWFAALAAMALAGFLLVGSEVGDAVSATMRKLGFGY